MASAPKQPKPSRPRGGRDTLVLSPRQLRALRTVLRQRMLAAIEAKGACTVSDLAAALGKPADALYYHVRALEAVGLIRRSGRRRSGARWAAVYAPVARRLRIEPGRSSARYQEELRQARRSLLRTTERELDVVAAARPPEAGGHNVPLRLRRLQVRLSPASAKQVERKLHALEAFLEAQHDAGAASGYVYTCAWYGAEPIE